MADTIEGPSDRQDPRALPAGARVQEYEILRLAESGGFNLVYLARDVSLGRQVALKEYMPPMASRVPGAPEVSVGFERDRKAFSSGLRRFINDARLSAQFDQPALVKVHRFWEENGTAYMVMPFYEGTTLQRAVADKRVAVDEHSLRQMLGPLMDALAALHDADCYHRDVSPDNVLLTANGRVLLDFGAARSVITNAALSFHVVLKEGYAPLEQYTADGAEAMRQGPWTDIYSLCAVIRYAITGVKPHSAVVRSASRQDPLEPLTKIAAGRYSEPFLRALDAGMSIAIDRRPQTIAKLRALLAEEAAKPDVVLLARPSPVPEWALDWFKKASAVFDQPFFANPWVRKAAVAALLPAIVLAVLLGMYARHSPKPQTAYAPPAPTISGVAPVSPRPPVALPPPQNESPDSSSAAPPAAPEGPAPAASDLDGPPVKEASRDVEEAPSSAAGHQSAQSSSSDSSAKAHHPPRVAQHSSKSRSESSSKSPEPRVAAVSPPPIPPVVPPPVPGTPPGPGAPPANTVTVAPPPVPVPPPTVQNPPPASPDPAPEAPPSPAEHGYMVNVVKIIQKGNVVPDTQEYRTALMKVRTTEPALLSFVLDRHGRVSDVKIARPTGSDALDKLAMRIVASGQYPAFPETAWPGKFSHGFLVPIKFQVPR